MARYITYASLNQELDDMVANGDTCFNDSLMENDPYTSTRCLHYMSAESNTTFTHLFSCDISSAHNSDISRLAITRFSSSNLPGLLKQSEYVFDVCTSTSDGLYASNYYTPTISIVAKYNRTTICPGIQCYVMHAHKHTGNEGVSRTNNIFIAGAHSFLNHENNELPTCGSASLLFTIAGAATQLSNFKAALANAISYSGNSLQYQTNNHKLILSQPSANQILFTVEASSQSGGGGVFPYTARDVIFPTNVVSGSSNATVGAWDMSTHKAYSNHTTIAPGAYAGVWGEALVTLLNSSGIDAVIRTYTGTTYTYVSINSSTLCYLKLTSAYFYFIQYPQEYIDTEYPIIDCCECAEYAYFINNGNVPIWVNDTQITVNNGATINLYPAGSAEGRTPYFLGHPSGNSTITAFWNGYRGKKFTGFIDAFMIDASNI